MSAPSHKGFHFLRAIVLTLSAYTAFFLFKKNELHDKVHLPSTITTEGLNLNFLWVVSVKPCRDRRG